jgi:hypothetical protein
MSYKSAQMKTVSSNSAFCQVLLLHQIQKHPVHCLLALIFNMFCMYINYLKYFSPKRKSLWKNGFCLSLGNSEWQHSSWQLEHHTAGKHTAANWYKQQHKRRLCKEFHGLQLSSLYWGIHWTICIRWTSYPKLLHMYAVS